MLTEILGLLGRLRRHNSAGSGVSRDQQQRTANAGQDLAPGNISLQMPKDFGIEFDRLHDITKGGVGRPYAPCRISPIA